MKGLKKSDDLYIGMVWMGKKSLKLKRDDLKKIIGIKDLDQVNDNLLRALFSQISKGVRKVSMRNEIEKIKEVHKIVREAASHISLCKELANCYSLDLKNFDKVSLQIEVIEKLLTNETLNKKTIEGSPTQYLISFFSEHSKNQGEKFGPEEWIETVLKGWHHLDLIKHADKDHQSNCDLVEKLRIKFQSARESKSKKIHQKKKNPALPRKFNSKTIGNRR